MTPGVQNVRRHFLSRQMATSSEDVAVSIGPDASSTSADTSAPPIDVLCVACDSASCDFSVRAMRRRPMRADDVVFEVKYCGVCHSDLHQAAGHLTGIMGRVEYPMVPGHELAGVVTAVGSAVTRFRVGDHVGVGCLVDSCQTCKMCRAGVGSRPACAKRHTPGGDVVHHSEVADARGE